MFLLENTSMTGSNSCQQMSRRGWLKVAGAGVAFASTQLYVHADDKTGDKPPIVGEGSHTYEAIHGWAQLPDGMRFGNTHMVQEDLQGRIFIHHQNGAPDSTF